jgi:3-deoxy-manno-octulosonate cytidylyltransferase (CMP-KDO synthetase)
MNQHNDALYMSRRPIPTMAKTGFANTAAYKQVCIIPFRRSTLYQYTHLTPTPLEQLESIDMLRLLEHGMQVKMVPTEFNTQAVDTPEDLARVEQLMAADPLLSQY